MAAFPLLIGVAAAWLTARWRRLAEWVAPVLVVIEIGVLFLCAWSTLEHALTLGSLVFGSTAAALLVLLALASSRAHRGI